MDVALSPLWQMGTRILNYLDYWLILAQSQALLTSHKDAPPKPIRLPGAQGQLYKGHTVTQPASFVPGHSYQLHADDGHHRVRVTRACVSALARCRDLFWLKQGVTLDTANRRKVVITDASNKGWGALCEDKPTFGLWSEKESEKE